MAFQVTIVTTKTVPDSPDFDVWASSILDPNIVYAEYPELTGQSIESIINNDQAISFDPENGFVNEESYSNDDDSVKTLTTTYESQLDYEKNTYNTHGHVEFKIGSISAANVETIGTSLWDSESNVPPDTLTVTGENTLFTEDLKVGDKIATNSKIVPNLNRLVGTVASIESDTRLTLTSESSITTLNRPYCVLKDTAKLSVMQFIQNLYNETYPVTVEITYANV